ncbi:hypothetical protein SLEP1_g56937 [Rubroshorea leprosula]|uniref:ADF-H domain-containing protein n=1 Tax=Rubroshorea leprosula TaxID=152421 RepID=A0AAV5MK74_9ROSI|nr:hypothetical protein SLEP1_g56937 [Rubroshorea leprosula]
MHFADFVTTMRNKTLYVSTRDSFKEELDGIQEELQATHPNH